MPHHIGKSSQAAGSSVARGARQEIRLDPDRRRGREQCARDATPRSVVSLSQPPTLGDAPTICPFIATRLHTAVPFQLPRQPPEGPVCPSLSPLLAGACGAESLIDRGNEGCCHSGKSSDVDRLAVVSVAGIPRIREPASGIELSMGRNDSFDNFNIALKSPTFVSRIDPSFVTPAFRTSRTADTRPSERSAGGHAG